MTATVIETELPVLEGELVLPEPVGKQIEWLDSAARFKVLRVGRRGAKTRFAFVAGLAGHGPGWENGSPALPGVLQGGDVVWIAQNYVNLSTVLWREEIVPRMQHLPWVRLNTQKHDVEIPGVGALLLRSGDRDAIESVRGVGKRLVGVIIDEAAWLDLRGALQDVILPALLDNGAWLIIMSTTNAGSDGGYDETGAPQVPSYFNVICQQIRAGKRSADWKEFTGTAYDNPTLDQAAIDALVAEYPPDSPKLKQEVFAELLAVGAGLALPKLSAERHLIPKFAVPEHWPQFGALDWGFNHPWVFGWYVSDEDGNLIKLDTIWGREDLPDAIADKILANVPGATSPRFVIHAGHDIFTKKGRAVGYTGPSIAEALVARKLKVVRASIDRVAGLNNMRQYVHWDESWPSERHPRFQLADTEGNRRCLAQLQTIQIDPLDQEDALKVDADSGGRGGDDSYDETRYALMSRPIVAKKPADEPRAQDRAPKFNFAKQQFDHKRPEDELERAFSRDQSSAIRHRVPVSISRKPR
jgi:hypothetical protein